MLESSFPFMLVRLMNTLDSSRQTRYIPAHNQHSQSSGEAGRENGSSKMLSIAFSFWCFVDRFGRFVDRFWRFVNVVLYLFLVVRGPFLRSFIFSGRSWCSFVFVGRSWRSFIFIDVLLYCS